MNYRVRIDNNGVPSLNGRRGKYIDYGIARKVYRVGRYVIKVGWATCRQNKNEFNFYNRLPHRKKKFVARVFKYGRSNGYSYIIQTYVKRSRRYRTQKERRAFVKARAILESIPGIDLFDIHEGNWIPTKNGIKIVDMGYCTLEDG